MEFGTEKVDRGHGSRWQGGVWKARKGRDCVCRQDKKSEKIRKTGTEYAERGGIVMKQKKYLGMWVRIGQTSVGKKKGDVREGGSRQRKIFTP